METLCVEAGGDFPSVIIFKLLEETPLPFLIKKIITGTANSRTVSNVTSGNQFVNVNNKKHADNTLKMKYFHNVTCKLFPQERYNNSK